MEYNHKRYTENKTVRLAWAAGIKPEVVRESDRESWNSVRSAFNRQLRDYQKTARDFPDESRINPNLGIALMVAHTQGHYGIPIHQFETPRDSVTE